MPGSLGIRNSARRPFLQSSPAQGSAGWVERRMGGGGREKEAWEWKEQVLAAGASRLCLAACGAGALLEALGCTQPQLERAGSCPGLFTSLIPAQDWLARRILREPVPGMPWADEVQPMGRAGRLVLIDIPVLGRFGCAENCGLAGSSVMGRPPGAPPLRPRSCGQRRFTNGAASNGHRQLRRLRASVNR